MKAIVYREYGPPDVLRLEEVAKPIPADNEILIRNRAVAVTAADSAARRAEPWFARFSTGFIKPKTTILGTEFSGEIEAVGKDVRRFKAGDPVFGATGLGFGGYAEYLCLPEDAALAIKPANLAFEEAAAVCEGGLTALPFLRDSGQIQSGQEVLINGASGSVGAAAVQLARYFGAEVTGVCSTPNIEWVRSLGAEQVIDYTKEDFTRTGRTYDIIFDAVGKSSFSRCKGSLKPGGIYLTTVPTLAILFQMPWTSKFGSKKAKLALTGLRPADEKSQDLEFLKELCEAGEMKPVIDQTYPLERTAEAHAYVDTGHKKGNVIVTMDPQ